MGILDRRIAVDERQTEALGEPPADGRFAGAHDAHEDDWTVETLGEFVHGRGYTALAKLGKSPIGIAAETERRPAGQCLESSFSSSCWCSWSAA
jgi:hypothetical protein